MARTIIGPLLAPLGGDGARVRSAMHRWVMLEMTGVMDGIDTDAVFVDTVTHLAPVWSIDERLREERRHR